MARVGADELREILERIDVVAEAGDQTLASWVESAEIDLDELIDVNKAILLAGINKATPKLTRKLSRLLESAVGEEFLHFLLSVVANGEAIGWNIAVLHSIPGAKGSRS